MPRCAEWPVSPPSKPIPDEVIDAASEVRCDVSEARFACALVRAMVVASYRAARDRRRLS